MIADDILRAQLGRTARRDRLRRRSASSYDGKVRDNYTEGRRAHHRRHRSPERVRRGARHHPVQGPGAQPAGRATGSRRPSAIAPNHILACPIRTSRAPSSAQPLPVEMVMRGYLTGVTSTSIWRHYEQGARSFCGHALPDGMKKNQPLPQRAPHADDQGGEGRPRRDRLARGAHRARRSSTPRPSTSWPRCAAQLFAFGQKRAAERGLILVDTKYELGRDARRARSCSSTRSTRPTRRATGTPTTTRQRLAARRGAAQPRQGVRAPLVRRPGLHRRRARRRRSPTRSASRRRAATSPPTSRSPGAAFVPDTDEPIAAHPQEPGDRSMITAKVYVTLKRGVLDPQGQAVARALGRLGFDEVKDARIGKYIELQLDGDAKTAQRARSSRCARSCSPTRSSRSTGSRSSTMNVAVVRFPGSNCDDDALPRRRRASCGAAGALRLAQGRSSSAPPTRWSCRAASPTATTCAPARWPRTRRSWARCRRFAEKGGPVLAICNGFQIACEAGLLDGALTRNASLALRVPRRAPASSRASRRRGPAASRPGASCACRSRTPRGATCTPTSTRWRRKGAWSSATSTPAGGDRRRPTRTARWRNIAGICNARGNVVGLMPHPERASRGAARLATTASMLFESLQAHLEPATTRRVAMKEPAITDASWPRSTASPPTSSRRVHDDPRPRARPTPSSASSA